MSWRILDQQVLPMAWPQDKRWWQPSWQRSPHRKCQRRHYDPDHEEGRGDRRFEHLSFCRHGCTTQYWRWPVRLSGLLTSCRRRPIRRRYADRRGVEKLFSSWICWKAPTGGSFNTSWSYARPYGIIRPISSVPGSGRTPGSTFLTPVSDSTITCERSTMYLSANRRCISSMTVQLRRR